MSLTTTLTTQIITAHQGSTDLSALTDAVDYIKRTDLATGTAAAQADLIWHDRVTLGASGTADLDLAASLVDAFGTTLTFVKLKAIIVVAAAANTNNVNVTRPASNGVPLFLAAGDGVPVLPGGEFKWVAPGAGVTVTAASGDLLTFTNSAGTTGVTYDVFLIGTSA